MSGALNREEQELFDLHSAFYLGWRIMADVAGLNPRDAALGPRVNAALEEIARGDRTLQEPGEQVAQIDVDLSEEVLHEVRAFTQEYWNGLVRDDREFANRLLEAMRRAFEISRR